MNPNKDPYDIYIKLGDKIRNKWSRLWTIFPDLTKEDLDRIREEIFDKMIRNFPLDQELLYDMNKWLEYVIEETFGYPSHIGRIDHLDPDFNLDLINKGRRETKIERLCTRFEEKYGYSISWEELFDFLLDKARI